MEYCVSRNSNRISEMNRKSGDLAKQSRKRLRKGFSDKEKE